MKYFITLLFCSTTLWADYGWIPKYQTLNLKSGFDYYATNENFSNDGDIVELRYLGNLAKLKSIHFWMEPEYGFAKDWSVALRIGGVSNSLDSDSSASSGNLLSSSGLEDIKLSLKWKLQDKKPLFTLENFMRIPPYSATGNDLSLGDGIFDLGILFHLGMRIRPAYFAFAPGFLLRSSGFSSQFLLSSAVGYVFKKAYVRLCTDLSLSLSDQDGSTTQNLSAASGNSFYLRSLSPNQFSFGLKSGLNFYQGWKMELGISKSIWGSRAPNYFLFTVGFTKTMDFYVEEKKIQIKEVPFDSDVSEEN